MKDQQNELPFENEDIKDKGKRVVQEEIDDIKRWIISQAEALIESRFSDKYLDKENLKKALLKSTDPTLILKFVQKRANEYYPKFKLEFYRQIYRLNGWKTDGRRLYNRPGIVGTWTNQIVYALFPQGVLATLRKLNPLLLGGRADKHHQYLTDIGEAALLEHIEGAISLMQECQYWSQFVALFQKKHGRHYQVDLFDWKY